MSSPIITLTSSSNAKFSRTTLPYRNTRTIFRDPPSLSSYLNGADETFLLKLRGTTAASIAIPHDRILPAQHRTEDAEIDVFDAQKYFNESYGPDIDALQSQHLMKRVNLDAMSVVKEQPLQIATLRNRSESRWNSQNALLHSLLRNQQPRRGRRKSFLAAIGRCSCSCRDNNSVSIDDLMVKKCSGNKSGQRDKSSDDSVNSGGDTDAHFSFPVFNPKIGNQAARGKYQLFNPAGKLNMVAWNSIAAGTEQAGTFPSVVSTEIPDDCDSDTSSDLFEIGSLSMQQESDGFVTPRAGYPPSEVSIEWSVVTASAADFSVLSDTEEVRSNVVVTTPQPQKLIEVNPKMPKRRSGILLGCRNHKAVDVADKAFFDDKRPSRLEFLDRISQ